MTDAYRSQILVLLFLLLLLLLLLLLPFMAATWLSMWHSMWPHRLGDCWSVQIDRYASACCHLDLLTQKPNLYLPWPRYISYLIVLKLAPIIPVVTKILYSPGFSGTFDLLISKSNRHIYEPKYICDQNWMKFPSLVLEIFGGVVVKGNL